MFAVICDWRVTNFTPAAGASEEQCSGLALWLRENPAASRALLHGEVVATTGTEELFPRAKRGSSALLVPVNGEPGAGAILCLEAPDANAMPSRQSLESLRCLCETNRELSWRVLESEALREMSSHALSNALHDFRSPLVIMRGYARMLLNGQAGELRGKQRQFVEAMGGAGEKLLRLVNRLGKTARLPARVRPLEIRKLWQDAVELLRKPLEEKAAAMVERDSPGPLRVWGDRDQLLLVAHRLLANAIELARRGAEIHLELARSPELYTMRLSCRDAGPLSGIIGEIAGADKSSAFPGRSRESDISAIVGAIVRLHGGALSARATERGYSVTWTLPALPVHDSIYEQTPDFGG